MYSLTEEMMNKTPDAFAGVFNTEEGKRLFNVEDKQNIIKGFMGDLGQRIVDSCFGYNSKDGKLHCIDQIDFAEKEYYYNDGVDITDYIAANQSVLPLVLTKDMFDVVWAKLHSSHPEERKFGAIAFVKAFTGSLLFGVILDHYREDIIPKVYEGVAKGNPSSIDQMRLSICLNHMWNFIVNPRPLHLVGTSKDNQEFDMYVNIKPILAVTPQGQIMMSPSSFIRIPFD